VLNPSHPSQPLFFLLEGHFQPVPAAGRVGKDVDKPSHESARSQVGKQYVVRLGGIECPQRRFRVVVLCFGGPRALTVSRRQSVTGCGSRV
jgi:hypothetical protein